MLGVAMSLFVTTMPYNCKTVQKSATIHWPMSPTNLSFEKAEI
jgi:hypothetical protein